MAIKLTFTDEAHHVLVNLLFLVEREPSLATISLWLLLLWLIKLKQNLPHLYRVPAVKPLNTFQCVADKVPQDFFSTLVIAYDY